MNALVALARTVQRATMDVTFTHVRARRDSMAHTVNEVTNCIGHCLLRWYPLF